MRVVGIESRKKSPVVRMRVVGIESRKKSPVIPAQAGIHPAFAKFAGLWIPACAGMTGYMNRESSVGA
ncbi:MAG: hypothetical protein V7642_3044, partial [Burkholderiales bacterium]